MLTLEQTDGSLPRSALRYRPTEASTITVDEYTTGAHMPLLPVRRASLLRKPQAVNEAVEQDAIDPAETGRGSATAHKARRAPLCPQHRHPYYGQRRRHGLVRASTPCSSLAWVCWLPSP